MQNLCADQRIIMIYDLDKYSIVPNRRRFGHVNVVCVLSNIVLAERREIGEGAVWGVLD